MRTFQIFNHSLIVSLFVFVISVYAHGQVPFSSAPDWVSADRGNYSTGAAWADINQDGWLDLVVANGNDMGRQHVVVYFNDGAGHLQSQPGWQSDDIDYDGHISIGDVNNDGYPDVAVSVYLGANRFSSPGHVKLYLNNHGVLSSSPVWRSKEDFFSFSCAFGDANGDGYPDLAIAGGESYTGTPEYNRVFYNLGGMLDSMPGWRSSTAGFSYDVTWADIDNDGRLDLVFANEEGANQMYRNFGDSIGTTPIWLSADSSKQANSFFAADVNNDGYIDLAVSDNNQLGGTGRFKVYRNSGGVLDTIPFWLSSFSGYGSGITMADVNHDGKKDLITGGWWDVCRIYLNQGGTFTSNPQWQSSVSSVVEAIVCGDVDNDGLDTLTRSFVGNGARSLYYLPRAPLQRILDVQFNHTEVPRSQYCFDLENGWISLASPPAIGETLAVRCVVSYDLDFAVSNWDGVGNFLYLNQSPKYVKDTCRVAARWNLVSVPPSVVDYDKGNLFPAAISSAFGYANGGYNIEETLTNGTGYWLKFPSDTSFVVKGWPVAAETIQVNRGWSIIGSISQSVGVGAVASIPSGLIASEFYGFDRGYVRVDTIRPWKGYWVRVSASGALVLSSTAASSTNTFAGRSSNGFEGMNELSIKDADGNVQKLYFGSLEKGVTSSDLELPPRPPAGIFDVRFVSGRIAEVIDGAHGVDFPIVISSAGYPLNLRWIVHDRPGGAILQLDGREYSLDKDGETIVLAPPSRIELNVRAESMRPKAFSLEQNYPNPFNPSTVIHYSLPEESRVTLRIFDMLGQLIVTLADGVEPAGYKSVEWNAYDAATGVYFCKLEAVSRTNTSHAFSKVRKMVVVR